MATVLTTGATGKQGGSLIRNLVSRRAPFEILAVTRNTTSASAQKLAELSPNIKLVEGDLDNPAGTFRNAQRVTRSSIWGVYSVQAAIGNNAEETQGKALINESIRQNVIFFIYSSVDRGGDDDNNHSFKNPTKILHFIKKHNIEHHLNLTPDFFGRVFATCFRMALKGRPLQLVATSDIGYFGADAFLNPEEYKGKGISLAGDELMFEGMRLIFEQKTKQSLPMTFRPVCSLFMAMMKDMGYMFKWFHDEGYRADILASRERNPDMKDFATWLDK
ncbi:nucleoside-diphosphate-sugar epimerase family protein [Aspergillus ellipticus CBS 707.79]|uniref:Nucleoside-diphosphate-sugar epimerase family protein n=1 Tax=Aspergillus ellipticus CBS 707.79 TaxID=1448320 RepID=A0A319D0S9_9EURO|nr:nucleoside-diphosphate-sugar epimerase family protein [Aspergillus ellipticus CBS 707.79]